MCGNLVLLSQTKTLLIDTNDRTPQHIPTETETTLKSLICSTYINTSTHWSDWYIIRYFTWRSMETGIITRIHKSLRNLRIYLYKTRDICKTSRCSLFTILFSWKSVLVLSRHYSIYNVYSSESLNYLPLFMLLHNQFQRRRSLSKIWLELFMKEIPSRWITRLSQRRDCEIKVLSIILFNFCYICKYSVLS